MSPRNRTVSSLPLPNAFTLEEYFGLERVSERRFEYRDGEIVCMSGGSRQHAALASNMIRSLGNKVRENCRVYGSDLAVYVPDGRPYRYPDASVVCGEARFQSINGRDCLENVAKRSRQGQDTSTETVFDSPDDTVNLDTISVELTMRELYEGLSFS